jgi:signal transduction histidine kinase
MDRRRKGLQLAAGVWSSLTDPGPTALQPDQSRRARLLLSIVTAVFVAEIVAWLVTAVRLANIPDIELRRTLAIAWCSLIGATMLCTAGTYALARRGHHRAAARILVGMIEVAGFATVLTYPEADVNLIYPFISIVLASVLLPLLEVAITSALVLVGALLLPVVAGPPYRLDAVLGVIVAAVPIALLSGVGAAVHQSDLSQIARQARDLARNEAELAESRKMEAVARLSSGIAHEFNNILAGILGFADAIASRSKEPAAGYATSIRRACLRAADLVEQLLAFSQQQLLHTAPVDLNELARQVISEVRDSLPEGVHFDLRLNPDLAPCQIDRQQMGRALRALVHRAHMNVGAVGDITIETRNVRPEDKIGSGPPNREDYCILSVSDSGFGDGIHRTDRIFDPFYTTGEFGTGDLEMAAAYGTVKQSGGFIEAAVHPQSGMRILVYLPKHRSSGSNRDAPISAESEREAGPSQAG